MTEESEDHENLLTIELKDGQVVIKRNNWRNGFGVRASGGEPMPPPSPSIVPPFP